MARKLKSDRILFTAAVLLVCVSVVMVYSASAALALDRYGQAYMFLTRQAMWTLLGLVALAVSMRIDYRTYRNEAFIWSLTGAVCVLLVLVLFSAPINGARRWFNVGGLGIQPSEIAKIAAILFTALTLERPITTEISAGPISGPAPRDNVGRALLLSRPGVTRSAKIPIPVRTRKRSAVISRRVGWDTHLADRGSLRSQR